ncbi:MAG: bifunctional nuclease family protein [Chloroflexota bacterium]
MSRLVEMVVESVRVHMLSNRHVVILKDIEGDRYLPIWIGAWEASAIAMKLQGLDAERPITHDLFAATLEALGAKIDRIVIGDLAEETYHAQLILEVDGRMIELDARPSDCVALAVRAKTRILVAEEVLDRAALAADPDAEETEVSSGSGQQRRRTGVDRDFRPDDSTESLGEAIVDERLGMFRDFINSIDKDPGKS